jgi:peptidylprolyl isomerase
MQGLTQPVVRRQIERQIMADEYVRSAIKEKGRTPGFSDVRAYYDEHPEEFKSEDRVKWLDIFINFNKHSTPEAARAHAEHVYRLAGGGMKGGPVSDADFVALVKQHDNGLASGAGGVGVGSKRGEIQPPDVEKIIWSLKPGEVAGPIATPTGYHIVKVSERDHAGTGAFDVKVQNQIREKLLRRYREEEYHKLIEELWRKGGVRVIEAP